MEVTEIVNQFVLLEHRWNGVHWDLMFEVEDILRTWAIDAPVTAGQPLPARELAPHRRVYLEYEGEVSGNRGTVRRVDRGTYIPLVWQPDLVRVELRGTQLVGTAELRRLDVGESRSPGPWNFLLGNLD